MSDQFTGALDRALTTDDIELRRQLTLARDRLDDAVRALSSAGMHLNRSQLLRDLHLEADVVEAADYATSSARALRSAQRIVDTLSPRPERL